MTETEVMAWINLGPFDQYFYPEPLLISMLIRGEDVLAGRYSNTCPVSERKIEWQRVSVDFPQQLKDAYRALEEIGKQLCPEGQSLQEVENEDITNHLLPCLLDLRDCSYAYLAYTGTCERHFLAALAFALCCQATCLPLVGLGKESVLVKE